YTSIPSAASHISHLCSSFFFNDTAPTEIYTLSLHDALPISRRPRYGCLGRWPARATSTGTCIRCTGAPPVRPPWPTQRSSSARRDRKSTRLNSSHVKISYAVFCLKKKNNKKTERSDSE